MGKQVQCKWVVMYMTIRPISHFQILLFRGLWRFDFRISDCIYISKNVLPYKDVECISILQEFLPWNFVLVPINIHLSCYRVTPGLSWSSLFLFFPFLILKFEVTMKCMQYTRIDSIAVREIIWYCMVWYGLYGIQCLQ